MVAAFAREGGYGAPASVINVDPSHPDSINIADAQFLFAADFHRAGPDLILTGHDGATKSFQAISPTEHPAAFDRAERRALSPLSSRSWPDRRPLTSMRRRDRQRRRFHRQSGKSRRRCHRDPQWRFGRAQCRRQGLQERRHPHSFEAFLHRDGVEFAAFAGLMLGDAHLVAGANNFCEKFFALEERRAAEIVAVTVDEIEEIQRGRSLLLEFAGRVLDAESGLKALEVAATVAIERRRFRRRVWRGGREFVWQARRVRDIRARCRARSGRRGGFCRRR